MYSIFLADGVAIRLVQMVCYAEFIEYRAKKLLVGDNFFLSNDNLARVLSVQKTVDPKVRRMKLFKNSNDIHEELNKLFNKVMQSRVRGTLI